MKKVLLTLLFVSFGLSMMQVDAGRRRRRGRCCPDVCEERCPERCPEKCPDMCPDPSCPETYVKKVTETIECDVQCPCIKKVASVTREVVNAPTIGEREECYTEPECYYETECYEVPYLKKVCRTIEVPQTFQIKETVVRPVTKMVKKVVHECVPCVRMEERRIKKVKMVDKKRCVPVVVPGTKEVCITTHNEECAPETKKVCKTICHEICETCPERCPEACPEPCPERCPKKCCDPCD